MAKRKEERKKGSLLEFLGGEERSEKQEPRTGSDVAEAVYGLISGRGSITKEELFEWGKVKGYTTADIMRAIDALVKSGRIKRRLDDEGKLIYSAR